VAFLFLMLSRFATLFLFLAVVAAPLAGRAENGKIMECRPGPWGHIEYQTIYLEAPEWIIDQFPLPGGQPRWCFPSADAADVRRFLMESDMEDEMVDRWMTDSRCKVIDGYVTVFPTPADVEALPASTRALIFPELA